jgi:hypothetical protein
MKGVAAGRVALLIPDREPFLALRRRPMGPRLRVDLALSLLLDSVVTHRRRRVKGLRDLIRGQRL